MPLRLVNDGFRAKSRPPARRRNADVREREYLTLDEYRAIRDAAKKTGRYGTRDALLIATMFRHALRVSEVRRLTWEHVHFGRDCTLHVQRSKKGNPSIHPLDADEVRQLAALKRDSTSRYLFVSNRGTPLSRRTIHEIVQRAGLAAGIPFPVHPHMLRHAKGFQLAQQKQPTRNIQQFFGHRRIESTTVYTDLADNAFDGFTSD